MQHIRRAEDISIMAKFIPINYTTAEKFASSIVASSSPGLDSNIVNISRAFLELHEHSNAERRAFLSELAAFIGGWNASPPVHPGRLQAEPFYNDDKELARFLFITIEEQSQYELKKEVAALKVKLYDLQNPTKV
jgi:hypothetical protein